MRRSGGAGEVDEGSDPLMSLDNPPIDWAAISTGFGVPAMRADSGPLLATAIQNALAEPGPHLIEAIMT